MNALTMRCLPLPLVSGASVIWTVLSWPGTGAQVAILRAPRVVAHQAVVALRISGGRERARIGATIERHHDRRRATPGVLVASGGRVAVPAEGGALEPGAASVSAAASVSPAASASRGVSAPRSAAAGA